MILLRIVSSIVLHVVLLLYLQFGLHAAKSITASLSLLQRETVPLLTSYMGKNTVSVLAHFFWLPQRANSGYILSIYHLRYSRTECARAYFVQLENTHYLFHAILQDVAVGSPCGGIGGLESYFQKVQVVG